MDNKKLDEIVTTLRSIVLQDQSNNIFDSKFVNGLNFENNKVHFTLELLPEQLKEAQQIKNFIQEKLLSIKQVDKVEIILTAHNTKKENKSSQNAPLRPAKNIIAVASGKGGVGKSTTAINVALSLLKLEYNVGILDADIYGPSLPKLTGISNKPKSNGNKIIPHNAFGLQAMSIGYLVPEDAATIWRGPMVMSAVEQLLRDVDWQNLDILIIDMPPGTGDAQLTLSQRVKLAGAIIVSTPQDLSLIDARKGLNMFKKVNVPILGIIENMSYFQCTNCDTKHEIFGNGGAKAEAQKLGVPFLNEIPLDISLRTSSDDGNPIVHKEPNSIISQKYMEIGSQIIKTIELSERPSPRIIQ
jgi:ATP-binding protein involved in chromosome partitioning